MKNTITNSILLTIITTLILLLLENKSQIPHNYAIPIVVSGILWYVIGNLNTKKMYSVDNFIYWIVIMLLSYIVILLVDFVKRNFM